MTNYRRAFVENSSVFITVVTHNRFPLLIKNIELLKKSIHYSQQRYNYQIIGLVILPNHFHCIIKPKTIHEYPNIIAVLKYYFSRNISDGDIQKAQELLNESRLKKREKTVWQRRYWEHTIRNEKDLYQHLDYIHFNPVKHGLVNQVSDWKYSSFHNYVRSGHYDINWGSNEDVPHIHEMSIE